LTIDNSSLTKILSFDCNIQGGASFYLIISKLTVQKRLMQRFKILLPVLFSLIAAAAFSQTKRTSLHPGDFGAGRRRECNSK